MLILGHSTTLDEHRLYTTQEMLHLQFTCGQWQIVRRELLKSGCASQNFRKISICSLYPVETVVPYACLHPSAALGLSKTHAGLINSISLLLTIT